MSTTPFVLLSSQRCGSTFAIQMLNSHPRVVAHGELLNPEGEGVPPRGSQSLPFFRSFSGERPGDLEEYLDRVYRPRPTVAAAGFKLMVGQVGVYASLMESLVRRGVRVVHLTRQNLLDVVISKNAAVLRDRFSADTDERVDAVRLKLNIRGLITKLEKEEQRAARGGRLLRQHGFPVLEVTYEELSSDTSGFRAVLEFLGVPDPDQELTSGMRKMNTQPRSEMIENLDEVREILAGTRFEWMLEEQ